MTRTVGIEAEAVPPAESAESPFLTRRVMLRSPNAEACWSVFSSTLSGKSSPNRDYASEGFNAIVAGRQVRILDGYAYGLLDAEEKPVQLLPRPVEILPWRATYPYFCPSDESVALSVSFSLPPSPTPVLAASFCASLGGNRRGKLAVTPFAALDFAGYSRTQGISSRLVQGALICQSAVAGVAFSGSSPSKFFAQDGLQRWHYKLGWGERELSGGKPVAKGADGACRLAGRVEFPVFGQSRLQLFAHAFAIGEIKGPADMLARNRQFSLSTSQPRGVSEIAAEFSHELSAAKARWGQRDASRLLWRMHALRSGFDFEVSGVRAYDAGSMWFRQAWLRDMFEAVYSSFDFFYRVDRQRLRSSLSWALSMQDSRGLLPNFVAADGTRNYDSLDATLLVFLCCAEYLSRSFDAALSNAFRDRFNRFVLAASLNKNEVRLETGLGLLSCPANYSWIDSRVHVQSSGVTVPDRIPREWLGGHGVAALAGRRYYLVETNAQWLRLLSRARKLGLSGLLRLDELFPSARKGFFAVFRSRGFLRDLVPEDEVRDAPESGFCSASAVAVALLSEFFSGRELSEAAECVMPHAVFRDGSLFGVLVKGGAAYCEPFLGDGQYHGRVCWPRDNPYLFSLLRGCGKDELAEQILLSNLSHQFSESCVGYCSELFAVDDFKSPLPVKNPAQLWSGFVSPFTAFLSQRM